MSTVVVVTDVAANGPAAEKGLRPGDLLVSVDNDPVKSGADVLNHVESARKATRRTILLLVQSGSDMRYVPLKVDVKK